MLILNNAFNFYHLKMNTVKTLATWTPRTPFLFLFELHCVILRLVVVLTVKGLSLSTLPCKQHKKRWILFLRIYESLLSSVFPGLVTSSI